MLNPTELKTPQISEALVLAELDAILGSANFSTSHRLGRFLRYVVQQTLAGNAGELKEYRLAIDVFGRREDFDPRTDAIVRVEARQLRFKLADYYAGPGRNDEIVISLPKGRYAAHFERHPADRAVVEQPGLETTLVSVPGASRSTGRRWLWAALVGTCVFAMFAFLSGGYRNRKNSPPAVRPANPEAEALCLKGKYYWNKRTPESLSQAVDYFTQAIVKDPGYACAYVGLADTYNLLSEYTVMPYHEAFTRAIAAARRAIALDDTLADAHNSLAFASFYGAWDAATAEREFKRALDLNPNYVVAHHWYATFLMSLGRSQEAQVEIGRAQKLDPTSTSILADKGAILFNGGQGAAAIALLTQLAAAEPSFLSPHRYLADIYLAAGQYPEYLVESRKVALLSQNREALAMVSAAEQAYATGGARGMLKAMLRTQKSFSSGGQSQNYSLAVTCSLLGEQTTALKYLQAAQDTRELPMVAVGIDAAFNGLHDEPAFQQLVRQVGLAGGNVPH